MRQILILMTLYLIFNGFTYAYHIDQPRVGIEIFYSSLSLYGEWIDCNLGYVWRPLHIAHGWRPYLYGRWVWTNYGWYWVSNEPFGWATFHYGRWHYDDFYGWIWIPDDTWGPAWVEWRYDDTYIGWAPLPLHATFSINIGITLTNTWIAPIHYWSFVSCKYFTTARMVDYVQPIEHSRRIFGSTRGVVNIHSVGDRVINSGVDVNIIERRSNTTIRRMDVVSSDREIGDRVVREANRDHIAVYRPRLDGSTRSERLVPPKIRRADRQIPLLIDRNQRKKREDIQKQSDELRYDQRKPINIPDDSEQRRFNDRMIFRQDRNRESTPQMEQVRPHRQDREEINRTNINRPPKEPQREKNFRLQDSQRKTQRNTIRPNDTQNQSRERQQHKGNRRPD